MKGSAELAQQPGAVRTQAAAGDSPTGASVPFWITACVRLQPPKRRNGAEITASLANAVFPAVQALIADRLRTEGEAEAPLNRDRIARRCGLGDAKKAGWLFDYLELIGFLRVHRHYGAPGRGRAVDTFVVYTTAPLNYVGPRTHAELERALDRPDRGLSSTLFVGDAAGHAEGAGSGTFTADQGAGSGTLVQETAGHPEGAESGTFTADQGAASGSEIRDAAGRTEGARFGTILQIDRSSISEGEIEGSIEPVPGGAARPPATGMDENAQVTAVRELVRRLPWAAWAARHSPDFRLTPADADGVQAAICEAMATAGVTLDQAAQIGQAALGEARKAPVGYVADAFRKHLPRRLRALAVEPLAENPLPLPGAPNPQVAAAKSVKPQPTATATATAAAGPDAATPTPALPACSTCEAREGEGLGGRTVVGDDGRHRPCPDCRPAA